MKFPPIVAAALGLLSLLPNHVFAKEVWITPETDVKSVLKGVQAGDSIILKNGLWSDSNLTFEQLPGTANAPISIRAETAGQVVFTGRTEFRLSGEHVVVSGLVFRDTNGSSDVVQLRTHSARHAHHCRWTDCVFEQTPTSTDGPESRWLSVYGTNNRIDHCYFAGKRSRGTTLVVWVSEVVGGHRIDHNEFGPRPVLGKNGGETIRIGTSEVSELISRTIVEDNYFHECDGEAEIVSNKSCENIYRHNVFDACSGALTLRHGHRCRVEGNVFLGRTKGGTGGVRLIGTGHVVANNYFEGLRGDAERAALSMMNGIPDAPLETYAPVRQAVITHNTFIDCKVTLELGIGAGRTQTVAPADCRITNNAFLSGKWPLFRVHAEPQRFTWEGNKQQLGPADARQFVQFDRLDLQLERAADGLLRPTTTQPLLAIGDSSGEQDLDGHPRGKTVIVGCDDPSTPQRPLASKATCGPTWWREVSTPSTQLGSPPGEVTAEELATSNERRRRFHDECTFLLIPPAQLPKGLHLPDSKQPAVFIPGASQIDDSWLKFLGIFFGIKSPDDLAGVESLVAVAYHDGEAGSGREIGIYALCCQDEAEAKRRMSPSYLQKDRLLLYIWKDPHVRPDAFAAVQEYYKEAEFDPPPRDPSGGN